MALRLTIGGRPAGLGSSVVARVGSLSTTPMHARKDTALIVRGAEAVLHPRELEGFAVALVERELLGNELSGLPVPIVHGCGDLSHLKDGYIVSVDGRNGFTRTIYRPDSRFNTIFATARCNSNCLMCSQPPRDVDDGDLIGEQLRMLELIEEPPEVIGITGGEPTLLKDDLVRLLEALKCRFPTTHVHMLTNGRLYSYREFVAKLAAVRHPGFTSAVPLYADTPPLHDYVVQAKGAFDQTVEGLYNAAAHRLDLEIRVVLHRQTVPRLPQLAEFVYRSFPFVRHVALMGLENMGYVKKNWDALWIDPVEYAPKLQHAVEHLYRRGMNVSIYNLQLCLLPRALWHFARQSISDFKNIYLEASP